MSESFPQHIEGKEYATLIYLPREEHIFNAQLQEFILNETERDIYMEELKRFARGIDYHTFIECMRIEANVPIDDCDDSELQQIIKDCRQ